MTQEDLKTLLAFFKTLADESRLRIIGLLSTEERSVGELAELLDLKEPTVSHHLARLKKLNLVTMRADGNNRFYALNRGALESLNRELFAPDDTSSWIDALEDVDDFDRKVMHDYFEDGVLRQIPTRLKKLHVVLRYLAKRFEPGQRYTEREVNAIIEPVHHDFVTLRRELIDFHYMNREKGVYWLEESQPERE